MSRFSAADSTDAEAVSLTSYLRAIGRKPLLARDAERALFDRMAMGDKRACQELIAANLKLVVSMCRGFRNRGLSMGDLISEGNLGLIRAAQSFDVSHGCRFLDYALWWIRRSIERALAEQSRFRSVPQAGDEGMRSAPDGRLARRDGLPREVCNALGGLGELEREVLRLHFGLGEARAMNLEGIALRLGLTGSMVRKIRDDAVNRMRHPTPRIRTHASV